MNDESLIPLVILALGVAGMAAVAIKPDLVLRCAPLTLKQRASIQLIHWRRKWLR